MAVSLLFLMSVLIDLASIGMVIPQMWEYASALQVSQSQFGYVQALYGVMQTIMLPILGTLSDRLGKRPMLCVSLGGTALSFAVLTVSTHQKSVALFIAFRIILGTFRQTMSVGAAHTIDCSSTTDTTERAKALGRFSSAASAGFIIGPFAGGLISSSYGLEALAAVACVVDSLNTIFIFYAVGSPTLHSTNSTTSSQRRENPLSAFLKILRTKEYGTTRWLFVALFLNSYTSIANLNYQPIFLKATFGFTSWQTGLVMSAYATLNTFSQGGMLSVVQKLIPSLTAPQFAQRATWLASAGFVLMAAMSSGTPHVYLAGTVLVAVFTGVCDSVIRSAISTEVSRGTGEVMAIIFSVDGFNRVAGPIVSGLFAQHMGVRSPCIQMAVVAVINSVIVFSVFRWLSQKKIE